MMGIIMLIKKNRIAILKIRRRIMREQLKVIKERMEIKIAIKICRRTKIKKKIPKMIRITRILMEIRLKKLTKKEGINR